VDVASSAASTCRRIKALKFSAAHSASVDSRRYHALAGHPLWGATDMKNQQSSELLRRKMEVAVRLVQLTIENSMQIVAAIAELSAALNRQSLDAAGSQADAGDEENICEMSAEFQRKVTRTLTDAASQLSEIGNDMRIRFAHLLTEHLASGDTDMLDAFQSFLAVLPARSPAIVEPAYSTFRPGERRRCSGANGDHLKVASP
jgi:hypothetical protein